MIGKNNLKKSWNPHSGYTCQPSIRSSILKYDVFGRRLRRFETSQTWLRWRRRRRKRIDCHFGKFPNKLILKPMTLITSMAFDEFRKVLILINLRIRIPSNIENWAVVASKLFVSRLPSKFSSFRLCFTIIYSTFTATEIRERSRGGELRVSELIFCFGEERSHL